MNSAAVFSLILSGCGHFIALGDREDQSQKPSAASLPKGKGSGLALVSHGRSISALEMADTVLLYQRRSGGWPKNYDRRRLLTEEEKNRLKGDVFNNDATVDNGATHTEIRILAEAFAKTSEGRFKSAVQAGIRYLLGGQYENGGWPQRFPDPKGYQQHVTFNDNAMIGVMTLLRKVSTGQGCYNFISSEVREECAMAVERGIACILKCQIRVSGELTVWCAQHDKISLAPERARSYELASLSGAESVGIVRFLMGIENPGKDVIASIEGAVSWFEKSRLEGVRLVRREDASTQRGFDYLVLKEPGAPSLWARFYDLRTNQPIFCSRDGVPRKSLAEISYERRTGYSWLGTYAEDLLGEELSAWRRRNNR